MTRVYSRSEILSFFDLTEEQKKDVQSNYYDELEQCERKTIRLICQVKAIKRNTFYYSFLRYSPN
jgi:uncharacterized protein YjaG (DUF416 family)